VPARWSVSHRHQPPLSEPDAAIGRWRSG
jgi:hypothetical protein